MESLSCSSLLDEFVWIIHKSLMFFYFHTEAMSIRLVINLKTSFPFCVTLKNHEYSCSLDIYCCVINVSVSMGCKEELFDLKCILLVNTLFQNRWYMLVHRVFSYQLLQLHLLPFICLFQMVHISPFLFVSFKSKIGIISWFHLIFLLQYFDLFLSHFVPFFGCILSKDE